MTNLIVFYKKEKKMKIFVELIQKEDNRERYSCNIQQNLNYSSINVLNLKQNIIEKLRVSSRDRSAFVLSSHKQFMQNSIIFISKNYLKN